MCVAGFLALALFGRSFQIYSCGFLVFWVLLPIALLLLGLREPLGWFTNRGVLFLRNLSLGVSIAIAVALFANADRIRDSLGEQYIEGYEVEYEMDTDSYGTETAEPYVTTDSYLASFALWIGEWVLLALCISVPFLTWGAGQVLVLRWEDREMEEEP